MNLVGQMVVVTDLDPTPTPQRAPVGRVAAALGRPQGQVALFQPSTSLHPLKLTSLIGSSSPSPELGNHSHSVHWCLNCPHPLPTPQHQPKFVISITLFNCLVVYLFYQPQWNKSLFTMYFLRLCSLCDIRPVLFRNLHLFYFWFVSTHFS